MPRLWAARPNSAADEVEFIAPNGLRFRARCDSGRIGRDLELFLRLLERPTLTPPDGWLVWVPETWRGKVNRAEGGRVFRVVCMRSPSQALTTLEFFFRRAPAALEEALNQLATRASRTENRDEPGQLRQAADPDLPAEAAGAGQLDPAEREEVGGLRFRPAGRGRGPTREGRAAHVGPA
ncbi:MAG TPA: hypothetical protein DCQ64_24895 [Candidatus Rokubacteria bacterium]|nr:hypothetical protein [Candidatus Rokubacteria bacterium]